MLQSLKWGLCLFGGDLDSLQCRALTLVRQYAFTSLPVFTEIIEKITFVLGPTMLFPVWGVALAVATLGYYYRRRGPCNVCGRGAPGEIGKPSPDY